MNHERVLQAAERVMETIKGNKDCRNEVQHLGKYRGCPICDAIVEYYKIKEEGGGK